MRTTNRRAIQAVAVIVALVPPAAACGPAGSYYDGDDEAAEFLIERSRILPELTGRRLDGAEESASSAESVGEFWFGQVAKCVIQSDFQCPGGAEPIRPFGDHSGLSVEAFDCEYDRGAVWPGLTPASTDFVSWR